MKSILLILILFSLNVFAQETTPTTLPATDLPAQPIQEVVGPNKNLDTDYNAVLVGVGFGSDTGILGFQYRRFFFGETFYLQGSALWDLLGAGFGWGAGIQTALVGNKCFWLVNCERRFRFSSSILKYNGTDVNLSEGETECEDIIFCVSSDDFVQGATYGVSKSRAMNVTFAVQHKFWGTFFYEGIVGAWFILDKPTFTYEEGIQLPTDQSKLDDMSEPHLILGLVTGFQF